MELVPMGVDCNISEIELHWKITTLPTDLELSLTQERRLRDCTRELLARNARDYLHVMHEEYFHVMLRKISRFSPLNSIHIEG